MAWFSLKVILIESWTNGSTVGKYITDQRSLMWSEIDVMQACYVATSNGKTTLNDNKISLSVKSTTLNDTIIAFVVDILNF